MKATTDKPTVFIAWSPINRAWFLLFGSGRPEDCSVLRIFNDRADAEAELRDLSHGGRST